MKHSLIIWDFDGVLADSEKIYLQNRQKYFNQKLNLNWTFPELVKKIGGLSDVSNRKILAELGHVTDDSFWAELAQLDHCVMSQGIVPMTGVETVIKKLPKQCVATGGGLSLTISKLKWVGFWQKYFSEKNVFTGDMVSKGKTEPDIFLLAAKQMNEKVENCIVVEDSIAGMTAAKKAGMDVVAFLGCEMYQNDEYVNKVKSLGVKHICFSMKEVEAIL